MEKYTNTLSIVTEEQECYLSYLYKYQQCLYKFFSYSNFSWWLEKEKEINEAISSVRTGEYLNNMCMYDYITSCIICVEEMKYKGDKKNKMAKKKTRKEKEELSKKGICWKCGSSVSTVGKTITCSGCGLKVIKYH